MSGLAVDGCRGGVMRRPRRRTLLLIALLATSALSGCGLFSSEPKAVAPDWKTLTLVAAPDANGNSALAVDVVLVKDKVVLDSLAAMTATSYFANRASLRRSFPDGLTMLQVEITPGQKIELDKKRFNTDRVWAALVFANYATPGDHRARLLLDNDGYVLQLNAQEFVAADAKTGTTR